jgi:hypothetical protein
MNMASTPDGGVGCANAWTRSAAEALTDLQVDPLLGLSTRDAVNRRRRFGPNLLQAAKRRSVLSILAEQRACIPVRGFCGRAGDFRGGGD